jgi:hypothetical protein
MRGAIQNSSWQNALLDPRNAISCTATWAAVTKDIDDASKIHSWDDLSIEVNGFGRKVPLLLSDYDARTVWKRNLTPATTRNQGNRRSFKIGSSTMRSMMSLTLT